MMTSFVIRKGGFLGMVLALSAFAGPTAFADPACMANGRPIPENNAQVLKWKTSTPSGWHARGNVEGVAVGSYPDRNGHEHFVIQIGPNRNDLLEVVYNQNFGALPNIHTGMRVHACGDFINSYAQNGPYPPSPVGAIIHWVHVNPKHRGHDDGYLVMDGVVYGGVR